MIRVTNILMENFRGMQEVFIEFEPKINIIIGINGSGKSSILDCLAVLLSRFFAKISSQYGSGRLFSKYDISNNENYTANKVEIKYEGVDFEIGSGKYLRRRRTTLPSVVNERAYLVARSIQDRLENGEIQNIPLAVYYPVNRSVLDIPLRIRRKHDFEQLSAYDSALDGQRNDFRIFFEWFRKREDYENEIRLSRGQDSISFRDKQLESVRRAIEAMLPGFSDLKIKRNPLRMAVLKNGHELVINQLSDGEKCLLALVGDLARRLAIANPELENPLDGDAIVLIDEIELHLHPKWQAKIINMLNGIFSNCQFILSSHSPQVLTNTHKDSIFIIERKFGEVWIKKPTYSYGQTAGRILEDIMGAMERPEDVKENFEMLFKAIKEKDKDKALNHLGLLVEQIGDAPEITKARVLINFL